MAALVIDPSEILPTRVVLPPPRNGDVRAWAAYRARVPRPVLPPIERQRIVRVRIVLEPVAKPAKPKVTWKAPEPSGDAQEFYTPRSMGAKSILAEVALDHGIDPARIVGRSRLAKFVAARHEAAYRLRVEKGFSMPQIGLMLGGRDHTTVLNSIRRYCGVFGLDLPRGIVESEKHGRLRSERGRFAAAVKRALCGGSVSCR